MFKEFRSEQCREQLDLVRFCKKWMNENLQGGESPKTDQSEHITSKELHPGILKAKTKGSD